MTLIRVFLLNLFTLLPQVAQSQAAPALKPVVFIVRGNATPQEAKGLEVRAEIYTAQAFKKIIAADSPNSVFRELEIKQLETLGDLIISKIGKNESFQGLILQGHGGTDFFYIPRVGSGIQGKELAEQILKVAESRPLHPHCFLYSNACSNFNRANSDRGDEGLDNDLARGLLPLTAAEKPKLKSFVLMGHRGMAGFYEWRKPWPTDLLFRWIKARIAVYGISAVQSQFERIGGSSLLVGYILGLGSIPFTPGMYVQPALLLMALPLASGRSVYNLFRLNYIATQGRALVLTEGKVFRDEDLQIRKALHISASSESCSLALSRMKELRI